MSTVSAEHLTAPHQLYPNPALTPGATNPSISQATIAITICNPRWSTRSVRPSVAYTNALKQRQIHAYGYADHRPASYEEDHFIPLELGGHPRNPRNLWPEPYDTMLHDVIMGAKQKDQVEAFLHKQVCTGRMKLVEAQRAITTDWVRVYEKMQKARP